MAMTKAEKAAFEELGVLAALRWTAPVHEDVPPPQTASEPRTAGWWFNAHSFVVGEGWSGAVSHGYGAYSQHSGSKGPVALFSTRLLALKACRHAMEREFAKNLRLIDKQIEAEAAKSDELPANRERKG